VSKTRSQLLLRLALVPPQVSSLRGECNDACVGGWEVPSTLVSVVVRLQSLTLFCCCSFPPFPVDLRFFPLVLRTVQMIIPVRCFTCGKVVGNKWEQYLHLLQAGYTERSAQKRRRTTGELRAAHRAEQSGMPARCEGPIVRRGSRKTNAVQ
jgi:hypothetical protein